MKDNITYHLFNNLMRLLGEKYSHSLKYEIHTILNKHKEEYVDDVTSLIIEKYISYVSADIENSIRNEISNLTEETREIINSLIEPQE